MGSHYVVRISALAERDLDQADQWLLQHHPLRARTWLAEMRTALTSLESMPGRCRLARDLVKVREVRQLRVGRYRVLFVIREPEQEVFVLRVRHLARARLGQR